MDMGGGVPAAAMAATSQQNQAAVGAAGTTTDITQAAQSTGGDYLQSEAKRKALMNGAASSTMLTGSAGVNPASLTLGSTSLLGS